MRLVNGVLSETLALADRAIQFGDGVFRTLKYQSGKLVFWQRQYRKLCADAAALGIPTPTEAILLDDIRTVLAQSGLQNAAIKIILSRGESARGYAIPADIQPTRIVQASPLPLYPESLYTHGARVRLCTIRAGWQPMLAGIKHLNRLENVLARREWNDPAILEGLLLDRDGNVLAGVMSNVLARFGDELRTPLLDTGGVAGVMREVALQAATELGWQVRECQLSLPEMMAADSLWMCNSLLGLMPISHLETQHWIIEKNDHLREQSIQIEQEEQTC